MTTTTATIKIKKSMTHYPKLKSKWVFKKDETIRGLQNYEFSYSTEIDYENVVPIDSSERAYEAERQVFFAMSESDKQKYNGKFVAIYKEKVEDCDEDESKLITRFFSRHGDVRVYIDKVGDEERAVEILSPFFVE